MDKIEVLFEKYNIKPVMGVIPNNRDPELLKFPKKLIFGKRCLTGKKGLGNFYAWILA